jgi:hypothetical protein
MSLSTIFQLCCGGQFDGGNGRKLPTHGPECMVVGFILKL